MYISEGFIANSVGHFRGRENASMLVHGFCIRSMRASVIHRHLRRVAKEYISHSNLQKRMVIPNGFGDKAEMSPRIALNCGEDDFYAEDAPM